MDKKEFNRLKAAAKYIKRELLNKSFKNNFYEFFKFFWLFSEDAELVDNWHIKYICDEAQKIGEKVIAGQPKEHDLLINVPPGTTKSRIMSIMFPIWLWINKPELDVLCVSSSGDLAHKFALAARDIVLSDIFQEMYPELKLRSDQASIKTYQNTKGGTRYSRGLTGQITGIHADIIIIDDALEQTSAHSKAERDAVNRNIQQTLPTRKKNKANTPMILVMQRLHEDDPSKHFLKNNKPLHICIPGELNRHVKPEHLKQYYVNGLLDPQRLSREVLEEIKDQLGEFGYAAQIGQDPLSDNNKIFNPKWWRSYSVTPAFDLIIQVWDTAFKQSSENDYSVCATWGVNLDGFYLLDIYRARPTFPELVSAANALYNRFNPAYLAIEDAASGQSLVQQLRSETRLIVKPVKPKDKVVAAHGVSPLVQKGIVFLPENAPWLKTFIEEHEAFPNGAHADQVDTTRMALDDLRPQYDFLVSRSNMPKNMPNMESLSGYDDDDKYSDY